MRDTSTSSSDSGTGSSRVISVNDLSMILSGRKSMADILEKLDMSLEIDRPEIVRVKCNIADSMTFDVRDLLGRIRQQQPRNEDWHVLKLLESPPDPLADGERTIYLTVLRDFSDMAECSAATFGRNSINDWVVPNALISRRHGIVVLDDRLDVWVFDGRQVDPSTNGLYFMDRQPQVGKMQQLCKPSEFVGFGPPIRYHDGTVGYLFHIRLEWITRH